uniref:DUF2470 domain-containing protein n=1 Tax=Oryza nivara TaxID=4536 RepID=A0A0E0J2T1_ORYNI
MLLAAATATAAPVSSSSSFFAATTRATTTRSSAQLQLSLPRRCRSWWGNGKARRSSRRRSHHCWAGGGAATPEDHMDELPPGRGRYHPFEEIAEKLQVDDGEPAHLTDAESARTIVEVNSKATVMISTLIDEGVHERIILPEFPYLTDENGDIYFEVDNDDALLESIMGDDKTAHVIIGLDNTQEGVFAVDDDDGDEDGEDEDLPRWTDLETMNSCHPLYFARMIAETSTKSSIDWLDRPPASLVVEGQLRPAFAEESTMVSRHLSNDEPRKDNKESGATFFKVEVLSIELITAYGTEPKVKIGEYRKARPDIIAHSAPNIISRLRAGGDKITQALKSLCWRCKAIQIEEAAVIGVDCLGFDLRVCSGTQVQTLRFAFPAKATSEFGAEKQIHELLFPRIQQEGQSPQTRQKES